VRAERPVEHRRATYANVTATLALVLSLAGVSYAAISLPPHSVGPMQLKSRAVTPRTLGFALGTSDTVDQGLHRIAVAPICEPDNGIAPPCVPPSPVPVTKKSFKTRAAGQLTLAGLAGIAAVGSPSHPVRVSVTAKLDGKLLPGAAALTVPSASTPAEDQISYRSFGHVAAGRHTVTLLLSAFGQAGDEVRVSPVTLSAGVAPKL